MRDLQTLLKIAQQFDDAGKTEEAANLVALVVQAAKEEEDEKEEKAEGSRNMSNKAKAKFRAVKKACESLCAADLDYRGPHKKECRKVEQLCEDILEALKECDLG